MWILPTYGSSQDDSHSSLDKGAILYIITICSNFEFINMMKVMDVSEIAKNSLIKSLPTNVVC